MKVKYIHHAVVLLHLLSGISLAFKQTSKAVVIKPDPPTQQHQQQQQFALLDANGNGSAKLVELAKSPLTSHPSSWSTTTDADNDHQHQVALKNTNIWKHRGRGVSHKTASILTILLAGALLVPEGWRGGNISIVPIRWILAVLYLLECAVSSTRRYLSNSLSPLELKTYLEGLQNASPTIAWFVECYHYRTVRRYSGSGRTRSHTSTQKVVTHRARQEFQYNGWKDTTVTNTLDQAVTLGDEKKNANNLQENRKQSASTFVKATLSKLFVFANPQVESRYFAEEADFVATRSRFDIHYDFTRQILLPNFKHKLLIVRTSLSDVMFATQTWFWILSLMGLTVPYRLWFANHCQNAELTVAKSIE